MRKLTYIILLLGLLSCGQPSENQTLSQTNSNTHPDSSIVEKRFQIDTSKNITGSTKVDSKKSYLDTIPVNGKAVIFFSITQPEYDSLAKDSASGIDEVLDDFNYYAGSVTDTMEKLGFKPIFTVYRFIRVNLDNGQYKIYDRLSDKENVTGYILTDGKKNPLIDFGVGTDTDFLETFNQFNKK